MLIDHEPGLQWFGGQSQRELRIVEPVRESRPFTQSLVEKFRFGANESLLVDDEQRLVGSMGDRQFATLPHNIERVDAPDRLVSLATGDRHRAPLEGLFGVDFDLHLLVFGDQQLGGDDLPVVLLNTLPASQSDDDDETSRIRCPFGTAMRTSASSPRRTSNVSQASACRKPSSSVTR